ncbi:hypothetical protein SDC9_124295 [bioreactor metagenome]|uniref:Uncharacterized protein n=1 Tax=bioreactor metagenome TaxID=1076179 RepID=A0A645CK41_9ZZZZ
MEDVRVIDECDAAGSNDPEQHDWQVSPQQPSADDEKGYCKPEGNVSQPARFQPLGCWLVQSAKFSFEPHDTQHQGIHRADCRAVEPFAKQGREHQAERI